MLKQEVPVWQTVDQIHFFHTH